MNAWEITVLVIASAIAITFMAGIVVAMVRDIGGKAVAATWGAALLFTASIVAIVFVTTGPQW